MPFENFYKEADQFARRWRIIVGVSFLLFVGYWVFAFLITSRFEGSPKIETKPKTSRIQSLTKLCSNLPKPEKFYPMKSDAPKTYATAAAVFYSYRSDRGFEEIFPPFLVWFDSHGWKRVSDRKLDNEGVPDQELIFSKDNQTISVSYYDFEIPEDFTLPVANYEIYCYEED